MLVSIIFLIFAGIFCISYVEIQLTDIKNELDSHDERDKYTTTGYVHYCRDDGEAEGISEENAKKMASKKPEGLKKPDNAGWHDCKKAGFDAEQVRAERLKRSKPIMDRIKEKFERFAKSNYKGLGVLTKKALKYIKTEWSAMQTVLQDGNLELSDNLAEQMMRHIKMNLKNCLNLGSEDSALDYAFMFSIIESCNMNKLSPGWYIKELVSRLTAKPCSDVEKVAILPCFIQK